MTRQPVTSQQAPWSELLGPSIAAGAIGLALHRWLGIGLYGGVELMLGSVPVLLVAILFGWRAGLVAGLVAGLGTPLHGAPGLGMLAYTAEAVLVGALIGRVHPALSVIGFWALVGVPLYLLAGRLDPAGLGPVVPVLIAKAPLQELFAVLLASTLLFLAPLRDWIHRHWPSARLPVVSLVTFQVTFLALSLLAVAGALVLVATRQLYAFERETVARYDQTAAHSVAARLESLLEGHINAVAAIAAHPWSVGGRAERQRTAERLLGPGAFQALAWLDDDFRLRAGWRLDRNGREVSLPVGYDLSRYRPISTPSVPGRVQLGVITPRAPALLEPALQLTAPVPDGGFVAATVNVSTLERRLQVGTPLRHTDVQVVDAQNRVVFRAAANDPAQRPADARFGAGGPDLVHEAPVGATGWRIRTVTPEWAVRAQVNQALLDGLPAVVPVLVMLAALGFALMAVMGQEFRRVRAAAQRIGHVAHAVPGLPDSFLHEFRQLYETFGRVSANLREAILALRAREAELTLSNSRLGTTVDELRAVEQSRGEVLNAISHDIKIPLTAIMGYTELLEDETAGPLNRTQQEYVQGVGANSQRVIRLLEDLLDLTRLEVGRFPIEAQTLDVGEALARTQRNLQPLLDRKGLAMTVDAALGLASAHADPDRVDQVLNNLVSNAIKYTPAGGHLALRAYPAPGGRSAVVQVIDDGPGISPEHLPHLFERFYRVPGTTSPGTGLGLAISKGLVEAMGGTIGVISEPGKGSTFWFTLPFAHAAATAGGGLSGEGEAGR